MTIQNVSAALTIIARGQAGDEFAYEDLAAFHAPSECYGDVERIIARGRRQLRRQVHGMTGLRFGVFVNRVRKEYGLDLNGPRWAAIVARVYAAHYPF